MANGTLRKWVQIFKNNQRNFAYIYVTGFLIILKILSFKPLI